MTRARWNGMKYKNPARTYRARAGSGGHGCAHTNTSALSVTHRAHKQSGHPLAKVATRRSLSTLTAGHSISAIDALELAPRARTGGYEPTVAAENRLRASATRGERSRAQMRLEVGAVIPIHPHAGVVLPRRGAIEDRERAHDVRRQRVREPVRARNHQRGDQVGVA